MKKKVMKVNMTNPEGKMKLKIDNIDMGIKIMKVFDDLCKEEKKE